MMQIMGSRPTPAYIIDVQKAMNDGKLKSNAKSWFASFSAEVES